MSNEPTTTCFELFQEGVLETWCANCNDRIIYAFALYRGDEPMCILDDRFPCDRSEFDDHE